MFEYCEKQCVICHVELDCDNTDWVKLKPQGIMTLKESSELCGDLQLRDYLASGPDIVKAHVNCRKDYTNKRRLQQQQSTITEEPSQKTLRSSVDPFDYKIHCLFCGKSAIRDSRHPDRDNISIVRTTRIDQSVKNICSKRNDSWAVEVQGRFEACNDACSEDSTYHGQCYSNFANLRQQPSASSSQIPSSIAGWPINIEMSKAFDKLCEFLEVADDELYTLEELQVKLKIIAGTDEAVCSTKHMKRKLEESYKSHIFFAEVCGKKNVICFRDMASRVINDKWYTDRKNNFADESIRMVVAAAKLIKAQIRP